MFTSTNWRTKEHFAENMLFEIHLIRSAHRVWVQSDLVEKGKRKEGIAQAKTLRSKKNKKEEEEEKTRRKETVIPQYQISC